MSLNGVLVHNAGPPTPNADLRVTIGPGDNAAQSRATYPDIPGAHLEFNNNAPETGILRVLDIANAPGAGAQPGEPGYQQSGNMMASLLKNLGMNKPGETIEIRVETIVNDSYKTAIAKGTPPENTNFGYAIKNAAEALAGKASNIKHNPSRFIPKLTGLIELPDCP